MASSTPSAYVTLVSSDGFEFIVRRQSAYVSEPIRKMLNPTSNFAEAISGRCILSDINGVILEKICEYLYFNEKHQKATNVPDMEIPPELCLELLMASDYLHSELFLGNQKASMLRGARASIENQSRI